MEKTLLFYEKDDYYDFKESKSLEGYSIISIAKLFHNLSLIEEVDADTEIIDLSALSEYNSIQSITEQVLSQFNRNAYFYL